MPTPVLARYARVLNLRYARQRAGVRRLLGVKPVRYARPRLPVEQIHPSLQFTRLGAHLREAATGDDEIAGLAGSALHQPHDRPLDLFPFHALSDKLREEYPGHPLERAFNWETLPRHLELDEAMREGIAANNRADPYRIARIDASDVVLRHEHPYPEVGRLEQHLTRRFPWAGRAGIDAAAQRLNAQDYAAASSRQEQRAFPGTDAAERHHTDLAHDRLGAQHKFIADDDPERYRRRRRYARPQQSAHPLVEGFPIETALRRLIAQPKNPKHVKALAKSVLHGGQSEALWGLNDALHEINHPLAGEYNWPGAADKLHLDQKTHEALKDEAENVRRELGATAAHFPWATTPERQATRAAMAITPAHPDVHTAEGIESGRILGAVRAGVAKRAPEATPAQIDESIHRHAWRANRLYRNRHGGGPDRTTDAVNDLQPLRAPETYLSEHHYLQHKATRYAKRRYAAAGPVLPKAYRVVSTKTGRGRPVTEAEHPTLGAAWAAHDALVTGKQRSKRPGRSGDVAFHVYAVYPDKSKKLVAGTGAETGGYNDARGEYFEHHTSRGFRSDYPHAANQAFGTEERNRDLLLANMANITGPYTPLAGELSKHPDVAGDVASFRQKALDDRDENGFAYMADRLDDAGVGGRAAARLRDLIRQFDERHGRPARFSRRRRYASRPSTGGFLDALRRVASQQQHGLRQAAESVVKKLGLDPARVHDAVHDTPGRSTPGVATAVYGGWGNPGAVRAAASWLGLYTRSPGMGVFHVRPGGPDAIYRMRMSGSGADVRARLDRAGIGQRLLLPHRQGFDVVVPDKGRAQYPAVRAFSEEQGVPLQASPGHFQTIGAADPGDARAKFRGTIQQQEGGRARA